MNELSAIARKHVPTVPAALKALAAMERELSQSSTYVEIRKVIDAANALKLLFKDVDLVKAESEDVILAAGARIGEEIAKVPKAKGGGQLGKNGNTAQGNSTGRKEAMPSGTSRARYQKLAAAKTKLKAIAKKLREQGKDATPTAVVRELTQGDKKQRRAARELELGEKQRALPDEKFGVILADPEWQFEPWSRETGMDRAADNHYPTSCLEVIKARDVPSIAAKDCALFLCATAPMLPHALLVMAVWGFNYVTNWELHKDRIITGYWNRNRHEHLLLGTRGNVPCPAPGEQWDSVIEMKVGRHSAKPIEIAEMIEAYFPNLPKIELNRRGPARPGWKAWGNEAVTEAAE
jgi:N6-adenosine-specific RNA methylase IME4